MNFAYVFLQVALVGAGILIYDQFRDPEPTEPRDPEPVVITQIQPAPPPPPRPEPVALHGAGVEGLQDRVAAIEKRQRDFERSLEARVSAIRDTGPAVPSGSGPGDAEPGQTPGSVPVSDSASSYSKRELSWFRGLKKEVETIERHERHVQMLNRQIDRLSLNISPDQQGRVVEASIAFRNRVRDMVQESARSGEDRDTRTSRLEALREEFSRTVFNLVPSSDAEKIVENMGRYPGYGFRRGGGALRGGGR